MEQFQRTAMRLNGEAKITDPKDFDQMANQLQEAAGHTRQVR